MQVCWPGRDWHVMLSKHIQYFGKYGFNFARDEEKSFSAFSTFPFLSFALFLKASLWKLVTANVYLHLNIWNITMFETWTLRKSHWKRLGNCVSKCKALLILGIYKSSVAVSRWFLFLSAVKDKLYIHPGPSYCSTHVFVLSRGF